MPLRDRALLVYRMLTPHHTKGRHDPVSAGWKTGGAVDLYIDARPEAMYDRIADVTGTGDRSLECSSCVWLPGAAPGSVGSRFRGTNRKGRRHPRGPACVRSLQPTGQDVQVTCHLLPARCPQSGAPSSQSLR